MTYALNTMRWYARWPIKWAIFALAYGVVCFPYPTLLLRHLQHWSDPNALIDPDAPELEPLIRELKDELGEGRSARETLALVEAFVYRKVPYEWDWNTWGMVDYLPTVAEVIEKGREDCDGRAVLAGSLLARLGIPARLVTDFTHVWIDTDFGETMGPRKYKTIEVTDHGLKLNPRGLMELPRAFAFGVSVFPLPREIILVIVLWLLLLDRGLRRMAAANSFALLLGGLFAVRYGGQDPNLPTTWATLLGGAGLAAGMVLPFVAVPWTKDAVVTGDSSSADHTSPEIPM